MSAQAQGILGLRKNPKQLLKLLHGEHPGVGLDLPHVILRQFNQSLQFLRGGHGDSDQQIADMFDEVPAVHAEIVALVEELSNDPHGS